MTAKTRKGTIAVMNIILILRTFLVPGTILSDLCLCPLVFCLSSGVWSGYSAISWHWEVGWSTGLIWDSIPWDVQRRSSLTRRLNGCHDFVSQEIALLSRKKPTLRFKAGPYCPNPSPLTSIHSTHIMDRVCYSVVPWTTKSLLTETRIVEAREFT